MAADGSFHKRLAPPSGAALSAMRDPARDGAPTPEMIVAPLGRFQMGAKKRDSFAHDVERPRRRVTFRRPFAVGRYAVTFDEYDAYAAATGADRPDDHGWGRGRRPVIHVSWEDATGYCLWLAEQTGARYRLPSEAEWEYVCRAGGDARYQTGDTISSLDANFNGVDAWDPGLSGPFLEKTVEVGSYAPNAWGFYDLHGNVTEWVQDCWIEGYAGAPGNGAPRFAEPELAISAVVRGGAWSARPRFVRTTDRWHYARDVRFEFIGFRVARDL